MNKLKTSSVLCKPCHQCFSCSTVTQPTSCWIMAGGEFLSVLHLGLFDTSVQMRVSGPADMVSHQRGVSGSAGLRWDLDLSSVYRPSISAPPFLPLTVHLMMRRVKPKGRPAPGSVQSRNRGDSSSSPCLKMKKQKALI